MSADSHYPIGWWLFFIPHLSDGLIGGLSDALYNKSHPYYKGGF